MTGSLASSAPLRILHLTPSIHPTAGGLAALTLGFAQAHEALGHDTQIWCTDSPQALRDAQDILRFAPGLVRRFPTIRGVGLSLPMERAALSSDGARFDIIHQHGIWPMLSRVTTRWRSRFRRPVVVTPQGLFDPAALRHSAWKKRIAMATYEGKNLAGASCLLANSLHEAQCFRHAGLTAPIAVVPNGIPDAWLASVGNGARFRETAGIPAATRIALFLSRIHPIKGLPLLVEAISELTSGERNVAGGLLAGWLFVIAGPDEANHSSEIAALARRLGVDDRLRFMGTLTGQAKRDAYAAADVFVLPTLSESFGIVVCEALGAGVPALTTTGAPWAELETAGCGWWVEATVAGLVRGLRSVLAASPAELRRMGELGKRNVAVKYTWSRVGAQAATLYAWLRGEAAHPECVMLE